MPCNAPGCFQSGFTVKREIEALPAIRHIKPRLVRIPRPFMIGHKGLGRLNEYR
jgi:hypothetical protein